MPATTLEAQCPHCNYKTDRASSPENPEAIPSEGDVSLCFRCGEIAEFVLYDGELLLALLPEDHPAHTDETVLNAQAELKLLKGEAP